MNEIYASKNNVLNIGFMGEDNRTRVHFPVGDLQAEYPGCAFVLLIKRAGDNGVYVVEPVISGDEALWTVEDGFLANKGEGEAVLICSTGTVTAKRKAWKTWTDYSLSGGVTPPADFSTWVTELLQAGADVQAAVDAFNEITAEATEGEQTSAYIDRTGDHPVLRIVIRSGGGAVESVNNKTGVVVLSASDVHALPDTTPIPVIDAALSGTSENPVQNKVVKNALDQKADSTTVSQLSETIVGLNSSIGNLEKNKKMTWELGTINSTTGKDSTSTSRIRAIGFIDFVDMISMEVTDDKRILIFAYNSLHNYIGNTGWLDKNQVKTKAELLTAFPTIAFIRVIMMSSTASDGQYFTLKANEGNYSTSKWREEVTAKCDTKYRYDGKFLVIAYSQISGGPPINTKEHFLYCAGQGFDGLKTDVRITSDNKIILCHDAGFTFDGNGRITTYNAASSTAIHDLTYAECIALEHAQMYQGEYCHPCGIDDFMIICKRKGMIPFITIRDEYVSDIAELVASAINKYAMTRNCIINSFTHSSLLAVRDLIPDAFLSLVFNPYNATLRTQSLGYAMAYKDYALSLFYTEGANTLATMLGDSDVLDFIETCIDSGIRIFGAQSQTDEELDTITSLGFDGSQHKSLPT